MNQAFQNRLRKMARHYDKWARRRGLEAYRIYDADLDEFPITVDRYADRLYVAVYQRGEDIEPEAYLPYLSDTLDVPESRIFFKVRQRQSGKAQYEKLDARQQEFPVREYDRTLLVNLTDYLDTGLFLDHRETRRMVGEAAAGKRVLNLFAYTCSFGVYAATAGAERVDNLDLSNTYLDWGRRNFAANGLDPANYGFLREDALQWLRGGVTERYDLIVLDPPTFSNSKMMDDVLDTQRDHVELINGALRRLLPGGMLYFSTNYRRFKLAEEAIAGTAREITAQTLPPDFRKKNLHRCWTITAYS
ncbi:23S rRNA G2069 N7-methylase RlmK/C1962 C5-methylase RlmI [Lewinella marina]|uniref:SAM-dependent methyltransferase n=1 Tax=Neolewinella marina TaxID=438751 RepID=A0A2G0CBU9_9BACT|nr:class I SAM-dependent methyltransferase [Neolewinella marina]NJB86645.1 23S rRNA G2069 N7-methylase RlmK/C1962 C5-methylase RlmI [Neolewinella marina]PHK97454.1 SAM-dependent methyltransferase [Neolewinella marina]